jgi:N-acetyl-1-D-myo-inositol-2-amino-2-deoxy-alpha-D-glucopyranoside deacetylase
MEYKQYTLLAVTAHPDDETFGMGGTLALYAQRGVAVHLICATRGEAGDVDQGYLEGFNSIADRRVSELRCAAGILGLAGVHFLDYCDSGMSGSPNNHQPGALAAAPLDEVAEKIVHIIRQLQPQVVVTFDPIGGYKHPDHIAIHNATVRAFHLAASRDFTDEFPPFTPQKLYYHVIPKGWLKLASILLPIFGKDPRRMGKNQDIDLVDLVNSGGFPVNARINFRQVIDKKEAAASCHQSQLEGASLSQGPLRWVQRLFSAGEAYMRAYPEPVPGKVERDLFAGIVDLSSRV